MMVFLRNLLGTILVIGMLIMLTACAPSLYSKNEVLETLMTFIGFLSSMGSFMILKMTGCWKGFTTLVMFMCFLSNLSSFMTLEMTGT